MKASRYSGPLLTWAAPDSERRRGRRGIRSEVPGQVVFGLGDDSAWLRDKEMRYAVTLTVPRRGGWRSWRAVRSNFQAALTEPADPAVIEAEIASEQRRGADYVRVVVTAAVIAADPAEALKAAWGTFRDVAADDRLGWDLHTAARSAPRIS
jgi:hypothetical protein